MSPEYIITSLLLLIAILLSLTVHEFAHAWYADRAGDPTPRRQGRVTLNPIAHLDPLGTILIVILAFAGVGFGWGKPVPVNPGYFRNPRFDWVMTAFIGPLSNIILAILFAIILRGILIARLASGAGGEDEPTPVYLDFVFMMIVVNVTLAIFNMIPLHPLDGSKVLSGFLPDIYDRRYWNFQMLYGPIILFGSILILPYVTNGLIDPIRWVIVPIRRVLLDWLLG